MVRLSVIVVSLFTRRNCLTLVLRIRLRGRLLFLLLRLCFRHLLRLVQLHVHSHSVREAPHNLKLVEKLFHPLCPLLIRAHCHLRGLSIRLLFILSGSVGFVDVDCVVTLGDNEIRFAVDFGIFELYGLGCVLVLEWDLTGFAGCWLSGLCIFLGILASRRLLGVDRTATRLRRNLVFLSLFLLFLLPQVIVQLLNLRFLQIDLMVLVHEFRACVERGLEEIVVLVRGALSEIVNSRLVDQLRGVNAHQLNKQGH